MDTLIKQQVKALLIQRDYCELLRLCQRGKRYWRTLQLYLYETDENLRWPAIEVVAGLLNSWWHEGKKEKVKEYIRSLLWLLNDESGGIGWSAPETIAETIIAIPELMDPYGDVMVASAFESPLLLNGSLWAIGRLGTQIKEAVMIAREKVLAAFDSDNPETLSLVAWASGETDFTPAVDILAKLGDRQERVQIYINGHFREESLGNWSKEAIAKIRK
ncbi:DVU0298 family protein [Chloroflexota bacterium]